MKDLVINGLDIIVGAILLIWMFKQLLRSGKKNFFDLLPETVIAVDVDTTRFYEYIWAWRDKHGLDTGAFIYSITGTNKMPIERLMKVFHEKGYEYKAQFLSSIAWRAYVMSKTDKDQFDLSITLTHYNPNEPYSLVLIGDPKVVAEWESYFLETFQSPLIKKIAMVTGIKRDGSLNIHSTTISDEDKPVLATDAFYPNIEGGIDKLAQDFQDAPEAIMLFIGEWGTGKSTLIRSLIMKMKMDQFGICDNQEALATPEISQWISGFEKGSLVALEDADNYIAARKEGNAKMSALLNMADGIIQVGRKIIISTNLPNVNSVDEALVRPGRTFATIKFEKLTFDQANAARQSIDLPALDESLREKHPKLTLSEAINYERRNNVNTTSRRQVGMGIR